MAPLLDITKCSWDTSHWLIFSGNVFGDFIYYSHLFPAIAALILGALVWVTAPKQRVNSILFALTLIFASWCFFDLILWATEKTQNTMFFWSLQIYLDLLLYLGALYLCYVFIDKKDVSGLVKAIWLLLFVPLFLFAHTQLNLLGFDYSNCDREALEGPLWHYAYGVEIFIVSWVIVLGMERYKKAKDTQTKKEILLICVGVAAFLLAFSWGNIVGSIADDWNLGQYGLFGMPVFIAVLSYLIVKYRGFGVKILATQLLVAMLTVLILSILFVPKIQSVRIIAGITTLLTVALGYVLVRSVKKEVKLREEVEMLSQQKSEFMAFASHEIRNPITAMRGYASLITDGTIEGATPEIKKAADQILLTGNEVLMLIAQFLDRSKLELGKVTYNIAPFDVSTAVHQVADGFKSHASEKGIELKTDIAEGVTSNGDVGKFKEVLGNVVDNSLKYTKSGSITLSVKEENGKIRAIVSDTGVGIPPEVLPHLFQKFSRADAVKANLLGTGLGLYLGKVFIEGMGGKIWAESEGEGKGSQFIIELETSSTT